MNKLVEYLFDKGIVGKDRAWARTIIAATMAISVREMKKLAEAARLDGHFVGYSSDAENGGIYLAETDEEREEIFNKIRGEFLRRLKQYSALKKSLLDSRQLRLPLDK